MLHGLVRAPGRVQGPLVSIGRHTVSVDLVRSHRSVSAAKAPPGKAGSSQGTSLCLVVLAATNMERKPSQTLHGTGIRSGNLWHICHYLPTFTYTHGSGFKGLTVASGHRNP